MTKTRILRTWCQRNIVEKQGVL